jgi:putative ABC transport system permease protein
MATLLRDVPYALRSLRRAPGFAAAAMLVIALGVGGTTAVYSVVYGVVLRPLPYPESEQLVAVAERRDAGVVLSSLTYATWLEDARTIEDMGAYRRTEAVVTGLGAPRLLRGAAVTPSLFSVLRTTPAEGRLFLEADTLGEAPPTVVLSHGFWQSRFGGEPSAVGRFLTLDEQPYEVVGVAASGFNVPGQEGVDYYQTFSVSSQDESSYRSIARLAPGITIGQATAEATASANRVERSSFEQRRYGEGPVEIAVERLRDHLSAGARPALLLGAGAMVLVLLMVCANLTNLILSRHTVRSRELAVRTALGAGRLAVLRPLVTETLLVSTLGGGAGVVLGWALTRTVPALAFEGFPRLDAIQVDVRFLVVAFGVSTAIGLVASVLPAYRRSSAPLSRLLREGSRSAPAVRLRALLLVMEAALAMMLLVGAVLLGRSFATLATVDPGYDPDQVLMATLYFTGPTREAAIAQDALERVLDRVRASPGVVAAGATDVAPFGGMSMGMGFRLPGHTGPEGPEAMVSAAIHTITPGYAEAIGLDLREGRLFEDADRTRLIMPMLASEGFARTYLADDRPILGRTFERLGRYGPVEIVGVVGDAMKTREESGMVQAQLYLPGRADTDLGLPSFRFPGQPRQVAVAVRTEGRPVAFAPAFRGLVHDTEPAVAVEALSPLTSRLASSIAQPRFVASVLGAFAALALALAATGLYGVLSYAVSQRRRELAIRAALGAGRRGLLALVMRQGLGITALGLTIGLAGAAALTRLLESQLVGVSPLDAPSFAAAACLVPAIRAARVDPVEALQEE